MRPFLLASSVALSLSTAQAALAAEPAEVVETYADIAEAMGVNTSHMSTYEAADEAIEGVIRLVKDCGCPENSV